MKAVISINDEDERTIVQAVQELFDQVRKMLGTEASPYRQIPPLHSSLHHPTADANNTLGR